MNTDALGHEGGHHLLGGVRIDTQLLAEHAGRWELVARSQLPGDHRLLDGEQDLLRHRKTEFQFNREGKHTALVALVQMGRQGFSAQNLQTAEHGRQMADALTPED